MAYTPDMRASDSDREKIASRLRDAHADGRLSVDEFQSRLDALYDARTYGEIEPLVRDLPVVRPQQGQGQVQAQSQSQVPQSAPAQSSAVAQRSTGEKAMRAMWTVWACAVSVNLVIWMLVSITNGTMIYFWPAWVAGPWGALLLSVHLVRRATRD